MRKIFYFLIIFFIFISLFCVFQKYSLANPGSFDQVVPFSSPNGLLGLFNRANGQIYYYDTNRKECVFILQVENLGDPLKRIEVSSSKATTEGQSIKKY